MKLKAEGSLKLPVKQQRKNVFTSCLKFKSGYTVHHLKIKNSENNNLFNFETMCFHIVFVNVNSGLFIDHV